MSICRSAGLEVSLVKVSISTLVPKKKTNNNLICTFFFLVCKWLHCQKFNPYIY